MESGVKATRLEHSRHHLPVAVFVLMTMIATASTWAQQTAPPEGSDGEDKMTISTGMLVTFEYTLKSSDGTVIDTSEGGQPFVYTHGRGEVVPGLETELAGMQIGDKKLVVVQPEQGYGPVNEKAIVEVPVDKIPEDAREVGRQLQGRGPDGQEVYPVVQEVREDVVVLNFNHPLAGETLHFDVAIVSIEEGDDEEDGQNAEVLAAEETAGN
jgi:FKBP-type peptidyl-prolyl cis-trans isomerase 2